MTMLTKLFGPNKLKPSTLVNPPEAAAAAQPPDYRQKPLRIIHPGGLIDRYYMAVPAVDIMNKYPRSILARPDIFRKPWESLVRPEEILKPGEKFYIVPRGTFRKLQKRMWRPSAPLLDDGESESESDSDLSEKPLTVKDRKTNIIMRNTGQFVQPPRGKKVRFVDMWQPSLVSIEESSPVMDHPPPSGLLC